MSPILLLALATVPAAPPPAADVKVPAGFTAAVVADNAVAPDISTMTIDDAGRVLVAGRGYVRVLVDANGDGPAKAIDILTGLKDAPMGLFAEGSSVYVVTDGGLQRYRGYNGRDPLTQPPETLLKLKTTGEHDAHAVRRGPDGWLYLLCGNMAGVTKDTITSRRSPVKEPVAGVLLRISPDRPTFWGFRFPRQVEVVADGFRNAYSFDFNLDGEPFTYDSDNERCVGLPWYEPCRFYHVVPGGNYGWRSPQLGQFWRKPPYFVDCVPPVCYMGRGSPTGVACYRHTHFPAKYRGGFFLADWTFGRIHYVPLSAKDSTYEGTPEVFAEAVGTSGFAPTALAVHPKTGELFVSIGGRGTRGGVYRISHDQGAAGKPLPVASRSLDWAEADAKSWLADARPSWLPFPTTPADQRARRHALEQMLRWRERMPWGQPLFDAIKPNLSNADPLIRAAAGRAAVGLYVKLGTVTDSQTKLTIALAEVASDPDGAIKTAVAVLDDKNVTDGLKLQALRIIQLALGDLTAPESRGTAFEGYTLRVAPTTKQRNAIDMFCYNLSAPDRSALEQEIFRVRACLAGTGDRAGRILARITMASDIQGDLHYLAVVARLEASDAAVKGWSFTDDITDVLLGLDEKAVKQQVTRDTFWPLRLTEIVTALGDKYPGLGSTMLEHRQFGRPEHLLFVRTLRIPHDEAAKAFHADALKRGHDTWTPGTVELMAHLPRDEFNRPQFHTLMEFLWSRIELRDAILKIVPLEERYRLNFMVGLSSFDPAVVKRSADALAKLPRPEVSTDLASAVKALRRLAPEDKAARASIVAMLQKRTGEKFADDAKAWGEWVAKTYPETAKLLAANDGFDAAAWKTREAGIAWDKGDADNGKQVFAKASCAACHDGGRALGPSLLGVSKRFGRADLLTAVLQPSKDVPARYRPVRVTTIDEKVYVGMLVYEATDGVILQTSADTSVRIAGADIGSKRPVEASLMPAGLLDKLTDAEVADLFAYMRSLEEPKR